MTQKREGESGDSPSLCHHSERASRALFLFEYRSRVGNKGNKNVFD